MERRNFIKGTLLSLLAIVFPIKLFANKKSRWIFRGTLAYLDGVPDSCGEYFTPYSTFYWTDRPIPVSMNFNKREIIGFAKLNIKDKRLVYEIELINKLPKKLLTLLTPCLGGKVIERKGMFLECCDIDHIGLCRFPADERLTSIWMNLR